jgi:hypothetical protein
MKSLRTALTSWLAWIGVAIGALSCISAIVHIVDFGLPKVLSDIVSYYRAMLRPLHDVLQRLPLPFKVTDSTVDLIVLYVIAFTISFRASFAPLLVPTYRDAERLKDASRSETIERFDPETNSDPDVVYGYEIGAGMWRIQRLHRSPASITFGKWLILCILLWPVLSFRPVRQFRLEDRYLLSPWGEERGNFYRHGKSLINKDASRLARIQFELLCQFLMLPIAVVLFFVLARFLPLAE